jgi:IS5 family transposase
VECIGKGKASAPYEFGVKVAIVTTARAPGGQFVLHAKALPANPYDGHTAHLHLGPEARRLWHHQRELRCRSAIEAVIGHMKTDGHLGRCYLKGRAGDAANAILTPVGYNFRLVLAWLGAFSHLILATLLPLWPNKPSNQLLNGQL